MDYLSRYFEALNSLFTEDSGVEFRETVELIRQCRTRSGKLIFVGNGGSAAIASHLSVDFTKAVGLRSINFNEADLLTCFSNDYGYENWVVEALKAYVDDEDLVFLISSSGKSKNIINAADYCNSAEIPFVTLSGFNSQNPLKVLGTTNLWVNSDQYNFVEMYHHIWLVALVDFFANGENISVK